jgi:hypothetical protein
MRYPIISYSVPVHPLLISLPLAVCAVSSAAVQADHNSGFIFYVGLQKLTGDSAWMRVNGTSFDNAQMRSCQARHDFDFIVLGIPGLPLMNRYISGEDVHTL